MGIVRQTYYACMKVKQILRTHLIKYEERDLYMSVEYQTELKDRINSTVIDVPQLFIDGQLIGVRATTLPLKIHFILPKRELCLLLQLNSF